MGANTDWIVDVVKTCDDRIEISALTTTEAEEIALKIPGVILVKKVIHWSEDEEVNQDN